METSVTCCNTVGRMYSLLQAWVHPHKQGLKSRVLLGRPHQKLPPCCTLKQIHVMSNQILAASVHAKVPKKVKILQNEPTASIARVG